MRAIWLRVVVVNVRLRVDGRVVALRRAGLSRKDMVVIVCRVDVDLCRLW